MSTSLKIPYKENIKSNLDLDQGFVNKRSNYKINLLIHCLKFIIRLTTQKVLQCNLKISGYTIFYFTHDCDIFLAAIAALFVAMSVGLSVGQSVCPI